MTREQTALYCMHHYHYVVEYLNWMAYVRSLAQFRTCDVKGYLFENLSDEENPQDRHLDMLTDYVKASGISGASVEQTKVLAGTEGLQAALAGMFIGLYWFALHGKDDDTPEK